MENQFITGIGCFAGPEKLSRLFSKIVQTYALGRWDGIEWLDRLESGEPESTALINALIAGRATQQDASPPGAAAGIDPKKITGFYLTLKNHQLQLSIFAKDEDCRPEIHSAVLDGLSELRQKRLN